MKRNMFGALTALVLALVVNVPFATAQTKAKAAVPFAFTVGQTSMPAGSYTISEISDRVMQIRNDETNAVVTVITQREESLNQQSPRLVFHEYGDSYILAEAWGNWKDSGMAFQTGELEKELRAASTSAGGPAEVVVALR
jgi:hypothetical protein